MHPDLLETREGVHRWFGAPTISTNPKGEICEDYVTRWKLSEDKGYGIALVMTLGLNELWAFPMEVILLVRNAITGRNVRFVYDDQGKVKRVLIDTEKRINAGPFADDYPIVKEKYFKCDCCGSLDGGIYGGKGPMKHLRTDQAKECEHEWREISREDFLNLATSRFQLDLTKETCFWSKNND
jgi:hypothetical protein